MQPFNFSNVIELSTCKIYLDFPYIPQEIDVDLLEQVFKYQVDTSLNKDQCRSICLNVIEYLYSDLEHENSARLLEIAIIIKSAISNQELAKIKDWAKKL